MSTNANGTPTSPDSIPKFNTASDLANGKGVNEMMDSLQTLITQLKAGTLPSGKIAAAGITPGSNGQILITTGGASAWGSGIAVAPTHVSTATTSGALTGGANIAWLAPIFGITTPITFTRFGIGISNTAGNIDIGIYSSDDESTFTRLVSTGSFACPGTGGQVVSVASSTITPVTGRRWYFGYTTNNATTGLRYTGGLGGEYTKTATFPLPATLTGMSASTLGAPSGIVMV